MGKDEEGTLARLKAHRRELIDPKIAEYRGRVVKITGDGILVEFPSVVDAVRCAVDVQRAMVDRNAGHTEDEQITFRVGINLGDVIVDGQDIYGDGVNVAARLEGLAEPGGLFISRVVWEQVRDRLPLEFADEGEHSVKNIARPVQVFGLSAAAVAGLPLASMELGNASSWRRSIPGRSSWAGAAIGLMLISAGAAAWWFRGQQFHDRSPLAASTPELVQAAPMRRLSILVLPIENLSHDPEQEYLADGITEDLTTDLSRIPDAFVIAAHTAFTFKGKAVDIKQIRRELGVRYVLEGSVQRTGDQVRVNAQLIDAESGAHLWADRFEGDRSRLGQMQDDVTARLARALDVRLIEAESLRAERERPKNPDAVDLAMRGWAALNHGRSRENYIEARAIFERALSIDPKLQRALDGLAYTLGLLVLTRWSTKPDQDMAHAGEVVAIALNARPDDPIARMAKGYILFVQKRFEDSVTELETAIADDRNLAEAYGMIGASKTLLGRADEAFAPVETAMRLSPRDPLLNIWLFYRCHAHTHLGQDDQAIEWCRKSVAARPYWIAYIDLASAYAWRGQKEQAQDAVRELLKLMPGYTVKKWAAAGWSNNPLFLKQYARIVEGLRRAGLPEQ
jgi:TolB-like protein